MATVPESFILGENPLHKVWAERFGPWIQIWNETKGSRRIPSLEVEIHRDQLPVFIEWMQKVMEPKES